MFSCSLTITLLGLLITPLLKHGLRVLMTRPWIFFYDIQSDRMRTRVAKELEIQGIRVQKSVFFVQASRAQVKKLIRKLASLVDEETDSVCAWPLTSTWQREQRCVPDAARVVDAPYLIL
ncbi:CRISPR-associated endonuclease Cas2 [Aporhodopirellula aestuarii]|uniref:CRISPR-associated endoribonuclease Cas2 n=1 Tax=Aporhodopirellula aestuarii TaxID=2950107 RepID=A0ABT0UBR7_9BACT|nr:CRISPR-associated endonuclease Cas2 [Aporhodopirellula aestuarii]MCM2374437.1 CRISPR-associated endonuclease Cas2 [Aporhodopirellula aestuarii]